MAANMSNIDFD